MKYQKILPFYMTYPLPFYYEKEDKVMRDLEYLQQMYPAEAKKYQRKIVMVLDKLDYENSIIYDDYPDRFMLYKMAKDIVTSIELEEANKGIEIEPEKAAWQQDMVQILLFYEIYKRRHSNHKGFLQF